MKRQRLVMFGALALGLVFAFLVILTFYGQLGSQPDESSADVIVAANDLQVGQRIEERDIRIIKIPSSDLPPGAPRKRSDVIGYGVIIPISKGEFILLNRLSTPTHGQWAAESQTSMCSCLLKKLEEPPPFTKAQNPAAKVYRFLWLQSFHLVAARMEVRPDGSSILTIKVADERLGFPRAVTIENNTSSVSREQTNQFRREARTQGFWNAATHDKGGPTATDCDTWILEGIDKGNYHVVVGAISNTLPEESRKIRSLGQMLLGLGQMHRKPLDHWDTPMPSSQSGLAPA